MLADIVLDKELGLTSREFSIHLPYALRGYVYEDVSPGVVRAQQDDQFRVTISVQDLAPRKLTSLLSIPRCLVTFEFQGFDPSRVTVFMENFDRAFQRGGG